MIRLFRRFVPAAHSGLTVLELGFGVGANIPFLVQNDATYWGIEGSDSAVQAARRRWPHLQDRLCVGDFTSELPISEVDVIIDRSSVTHNDTDAIMAALRLVTNALAPQGLMLATDWFSVQDSSYLSGTEVDAWTRTDIQDGQFGGLGRVHFSSEEHLRELLAEAQLQPLFVEHKSRENLTTGHRHASFDFVAQRQ